MGKNGSVWGIGIVLSILGLLIALSYIPIHIRLEAESDLYRGRLRVSCCYLLLRIRLNYRLDLLERPYFTLSRINGFGGLYPVKRKGKKKQWLDHQEVLNLIRRSKLQALTAQVTLGFPGDAAVTALLSGFLHELLLKLFLYFFRESRDTTQVQVKPDFERAILQARLQCMFSVKPVKIVLEIFRIRIRNRAKRKVKTIAPSH